MQVRFNSFNNVNFKGYLQVNDTFINTDKIKFVKDNQGTDKKPVIYLDNNDEFFMVNTGLSAKQITERIIAADKGFPKAEAFSYMENTKLEK